LQPKEESNVSEKWIIEQIGNERILCYWHEMPDGIWMKREIAVFCDWNGHEDQARDEEVVLEALECRKSESTQYKEWVSVEERMPGPGNDVIVFAPLYSDSGVTVSSTRLIEGIELWELAEDVGDDGHVTHWRELPAPPDTTKGEK
jgi:hypothetical protein